MKRAAVIGSPISHSISPKIFALVSKHLGVTDFHYDALEVRSSELESFFREIREDPEFLGLNVTIPHKEPALRLCAFASDEARAIGAANVIETRFDEHGLKAHNTDVLGVLHTLRHAAPVPIAGKDALLIGAGGAARAVAYALGLSGARQVVVTGSGARAGTFAKEFSSLFPKTEFRADDFPIRDETLRLSLLVNCSPIGMSGVPCARDGMPAEEYFAPLRTLSFAPDALAFDLVYRPERTAFLNHARAAGLRTVSGLPMLVSQALASWEIWFGEIPQPRKSSLQVELESSLRADFADSSPIFLTGFMGAGKSVVGHVLARRLGWKFLDTDRMVERRSGRSIPEIFRESGEARFREIEREAVAEAATNDRSVVSLGGGALLDPGSLSLARESGRLIYLSASPAELATRLRHSAHQRPLLAGLEETRIKEKIASLLADREPIYCQAAIRIETDGKSVEDIAEETLRFLSGKGEASA